MITFRTARVAIAAALLAGPAAAQMPRFEMKAIPRPAEPDAVPLYPAGTLPKGAAPESWARLLGYFQTARRWTRAPRATWPSRR